MGMSAVRYKLMPENLDSDLSKVENQAKEIIESSSGIYDSSEQIPIAFGLKSLQISFAYPEEKDIDEIGNKLSQIEGVSSVEMTDYRRALG